jgi:hypothetical protein
MTDINPDLLSELKQQNENLCRLAAEISESDRGIAELVGKLGSATQQHQTLRAAFEDAQANLDQLAKSLPDGDLRDLLGGAGVSSDATRVAFSSLASGEQERWAYNQLRYGSKSQVAICKRFDEEMSGDSDELVHFLAASKYFRQTGEKEIMWEIAANREDDLKELFAN